MRSREELHEMFARFGGIMRTGQLSEQKIFYVELQELLAAGIIEKIRYGCYRMAGEPLDEMQTVSVLFPDGIFCAETALYHYGYIAAMPSEWHLAVSKDSGKSRFRLDYPFVKPYYLEPDLLELGLTDVPSANGTVRMYDRERVICEVLRYRNKMDRALFGSALRNYIADPQKDLSRLSEYAAALRVSKTVRDTLGMWL